MAAPQDICHEVEASRAVKDNTRTNTRRFYCPQCDATFARSSHMRRHQRMHRVDKPFTCQYCPLSSSRKDAIIRHTRTFHTGQILDSSCKENEQTDVVDIEIGAPHESPLGDCSVLEDPVRMGGLVPSHTPIIETQAPFQMPLSPSHVDLGSIELSTWLQFNGGAVSLSPTSHENHVLSGGDTFATSQVDFDPQLFDIGILAALDQLVDIGGMLEEQGNVQSMPAALPKQAGTPTSDYEERNAQTCLSITVDAHSRAKANFLNLSLFNGQEKLSDMHFPSRPAMVRFVKAYFTHMAPYVPVVHGPTFDVSSLPPPFLLEIMACGAVYSNETKVAMNMHRNVLKLLLNGEFTSICDDTGIEFELSRLQTMLLATYFGILSGDSHLEERAKVTFHYVIELVEEAIKKLAAPAIESQTTWIYQETISRCISCSIIIASGYFSASVNRSLNISYLDSKYPLPCTTSQWSRAEASQDTPKPVIYNSEIMEGIMHGNKPPSELSEYAFLAVVCNIRCRICSFEAFSISRHPNLKSTFIETMEEGMNTLSQAWSRMNYDHSSPLHRHTNSALNSAFLHLYSSHELSGMKRLLRNPEVLRDPQELSSLFDSPCSPQLKRGLICAAKTLQLDFETGVNYVRITAPLRFDPLEIHALCESSLLLFWYLMSKKINPKTFEWHQDISDTVEEVLSEVKDLAVGSRVEILPLAACATMLGSSMAVWRLPPAVSQGLQKLIAQVQAINHLWI